ncbi:MAG: 4-alpha-glucanotransferase [Puniceicoccales bacterium]|nr:4-alpha-glucanotransferase [Puniceicoccales bacterium]
MDFDFSFKSDPYEPNFRRKSGLSFNLTDVAGKFGYADVGEIFNQWLAALAHAGQTLWHIPTLHRSTNPHRLTISHGLAFDEALISLANLQSLGLLTEAESTEAEEKIANTKNIDEITTLRKKYLDLVSAKFDDRASKNLLAELMSFEKTNESWLNNYALFYALKHIFAGKPWWQWPEKIKDFDRKAIEATRKQLSLQIRSAGILQFLLHKQLESAKNEAKKFGITLITDFKIYVEQDSPDVWTNQNLFFLDQTGQCTTVAGIPSSMLYPNGLKLGAPTYRWNRHRESNYHWFIQRLKKELQIFDYVILENFHELLESWEIPIAEANPNHGRWVPSGGGSLFEKIKNSFESPLPIIASETYSDFKSKRIINRFNFANLHVLQYAFDEKFAHKLPKNYDETCLTIISASRENSLISWLNEYSHSSKLPKIMRKEFQECFGSNINESTWKAIDKLLNSNADAVILPLYDLLHISTKDTKTYININPTGFLNKLKQKLGEATIAAHRASFPN